ncbi:MAG: 23S rRNA (adenine(2503)-C(2))-methyltransferase RlmN [Bacteroidetes bacterium]|nr:23S rRNA (adenine(2503)-C(2))-methyltransferase RlmN [Rhodothermia bacterium]MCS7154914.1 23S rRNA (adenine(2503)-C(2))-methyltransferase RlmN [Bacteroidota bacterium]MCX7906927.1 23S rRNA (adenine(2503)-C(2))-methyltransferase RlmN [Bacteroidota bacterium]MDW8137709.1 23S rRNA (adenine(2503)-C(2))-methyltransferase RlmN [Bacteroidota bacterium]MDW8285337.1 23S rRNA (adenine(2503)-C(2))-methyltransferase RlmN [Bacteroidota bacterium]
MLEKTVSHSALLNLYGLSLSELEALMCAWGEPAYRGRQLFQWIYQKQAESFQAMSSLPKRLRERLAVEARLERIRLERLQRASDGTVKFLFRLRDGRAIESVLIPDFDESGAPKRLTVCVSSQVGCALRCAFCATGQMGFWRNLDPGEIVDQVAQLDRYARVHWGRAVTNVVYMGMGEPLQNYRNVLLSSQILCSELGLAIPNRHITVSTAGLARQIRQLADDGARFKLALSLHAPDDEKRSRIMPINKGNDLEALREALRYYYAKCRRRITYEYVLLRDFNDSEADARKLIQIARWVPCKINLLWYNPVPGAPFARTTPERLERFRQVLLSAHVTVTVRRSRGDDIEAACGQLAVREQAQRVDLTTPEKALTL